MNSVRSFLYKTFLTLFIKFSSYEIFIQRSPTYLMYLTSCINVTTITINEDIITR